MKIFTKAKWYYNRLRAMSGPEILHRVSESGRKRCDRMLLPYKPKDLGPLPELPGLKAGITSLPLNDTLRKQWQEHVEQAKTGRFYLLGQQWPACEPHRKWHLDPVTGSCWPHDTYCFSINYRHTDKKGDVKYVWELGRMQYLQSIAALAFKENDEALMCFALSELQSWIDHNPPHKGVHWASGIELGLRVVSILIVTTLCNTALTPALRGKIWACLREHGRWLARYPSRFSSANNHMTAEGLGLFILGALCPQWRESRLWKQDGWEMLLETAQDQILPDGVGAEQTPNYSAVVLEMLLLGLHIAKATDSDVPTAYLNKIRLSAEYLRWFTDAGGNVPRIGDDDNARVLGAYRADEAYVNSVLGAAAAVLLRPDLAPPACAPHLRNAVFGLPPEAAQPQEGLHTFEQAGYTVGRHYVKGREVWLAVDHGYLGYLSIAAHGHADALSVWLHLDGKPVLVDSGTYLYHSGGAWRDHFRGTPAHNTLCMEGVNSSIISGHFNWSHKANATRNLLETGPDHWQVDCSHDGYLARFGALHRRRVALTPARGLTVEDSITGDAPRKVEIGFLLYPGLEASQEGNEITVSRNDAPILRVRHLSALAASVGRGWYSPTFAQKNETKRIVFSGELTPGAKAVTDFTFVWPG